VVAAAYSDHMLRSAETATRSRCTRLTRMIARPKDGRRPLGRSAYSSTPSGRPISAPCFSQNSTAASTVRIHS
jgi:hypothetical protein